MYAHHYLIRLIWSKLEIWKSITISVISEIWARYILNGFGEILLEKLEILQGMYGSFTLIFCHPIAISQFLMAGISINIACKELKNLTSWSSLSAISTFEFSLYLNDSIKAAFRIWNLALASFCLVVTLRQIIALLCMSKCLMLKATFNLYTATASTS